jgi:hypothetical protein
VTGEDRVMTIDRVAALFAGDMPRNQRHRYIDIDKRAAGAALHVIVPLDPFVISARLIGKGQFLDQTMLG